MNTLYIHASKAYPVYLGSDLLHTLESDIQKHIGTGKACIVSDSNVWPLYGKSLMRQLTGMGITVTHFTFPAGESSKNADNYLGLLRFLSQHQYTRTDCVLALGGGVTGDLAGFAAATYLRGISYIQIPTSLLAMVDSSVGGKTGIDLPEGKNLVGAFYQPAAVICSTDTLQSLPEEEFQNGCAEIIKYAVLYDPALFDHLVKYGMHFDRQWVISRCIDHKRRAVEKDEYDLGCRALLNLGHTVGHAIEKCSDYTVSHGKAVAIGMAVVSRAAGCRDKDRIVSLLEQFGLPVRTGYSAQELAACALSDKKRSSETIHLVIPVAIGDCTVVPTPVDELQAFIKKGL